MRIATLLAGLGLLQVLAVDLYLLLIDTYRGTECTAGQDASVVCHDVSRSFLAENGDSFIVLLIIPTVAAAMVLLLTLPGVHLTRFFSWLGVTILLGFCLIGSASIGLFYAPALLLCLLAALVRAEPVPARQS